MSLRELYFINDLRSKEYLNGKKLLVFSSEMFSLPPFVDRLRAVEYFGVSNFVTYPFNVNWAEVDGFEEGLESDMPDRKSIKMDKRHRYKDEQLWIWKTGRYEPIVVNWSTKHTTRPLFEALYAEYCDKGTRTFPTPILVEIYNKRTESTHPRKYVTDLVAVIRTILMSHEVYGEGLVHLPYRKDKKAYVFSLPE